MRKILLLLFLATYANGYTQDVVSCDDEDFRQIMRSLVSKGNLYYETSDRYGINRMIDSISSCLLQRIHNGKINKMDSLEYTADLYKLQGSYYYENSYYDSTSYSKAHEYYLKALDIYRGESAFAGDLECEPMIHRELAQLYYKEKNYQEAYNHTKEAYDAFENAVNLQIIDDNDCDYLDIQTQMAICQAHLGHTEDALVIMEHLIKRYENDGERYGEALRKKAKILMLQEESIGKTGRTEALECYKLFFEIKKNDALAHFMGMNSKEREQYWMRIRPFVTDCYRLEDADAGFLYDVTLFAKGLLLQLDSAGGGRQNIHATWRMIQEKLKPDACAIEFIQYEKHGQQQMGALVLKKTGNPVFVKLTSPDSIWEYKLGIATVKERLSRTDKEQFIAIDRVYNDSIGLFQLVWTDSLLAEIRGNNKVYFSPDGYMHRIAVEYMLPREASQLRLYRLSSTRRLLDDPVAIKNKEALIIGDVNFNCKVIPCEGNNDFMAYQAMRGLTFSNILESKEEIDSILICRNNPSDKLLSGHYANEETFRELCSNYSIIHLSTHGKFMAKSTPYGTELKPCLSDESLSENIIALAGLNVSLRDEQFDSNHNYDGVLSAKELASCNMKDVELTVLACCESGLGQITPDGVYGIQRGLKNAGAGTIVMSLWEAESQTTTQFMISFYKKIQGGSTICEAFSRTRAEMWKLDEEDPRPCYWNVFILIDAIE